MTTHQPHGEVLRAIRLQCDPPMRQGALAERIGVVSSTISAFERGTRGFSIQQLRAAAEAIAAHHDMTAGDIAAAVVMGEVPQCPTK